jgi:hypothetical protein
VRIADEAEMDVIRERIINEVIDGYFEENGDDEDFLAVYEIFASAKNDKGFVTALLDVEKRLSSLPDPEGFCRNVLENYRQAAECGEFFDTVIGSSFKEKTLAEAKRAEELLEKLCDACRSNATLADKYLPSVECELNLAKNVIVACDKGYSAVKSCIDGAEKVAFKAIRGFEDPELQNLIKDAKSLVSGQLRDMLAERFCCEENLLCTCAADTEKILSKLASASEVIITDSYDKDDAVMIATEAGRVYIPLSEVIDFEKERERLNAEMKKNEGEIERIEKKLSNEGFVAKAPPKVIEGEREKLKKYLEMRESLTEALKKLV